DAYLHAFGPHDEGSGQDSARGVNVEIGEMVLVDQGAIKAQVFAERPLIEVLLVRLGGELRIAEFICEACLRTDVVRDTRLRCLIEGVDLNPTPSSRHTSSARYSCVLACVSHARTHARARVLHTAISPAKLAG